ncbi:MAG: molybdopterin-dependent oxidoreductase [Campylobacterales bacterium]|nr:molybdopterin-dependent oxidoreductase [Campylobacterales bacterium]
MKTVSSVCTYCGTGCDILADIEDNTIQKIYAKKDGEVSEGKLCIKGKEGYEYLYSSNRIKNPRVKKSFIEKNRASFPKEIQDKLFLLHSYDNDFYECDLDIAIKLAGWKIKEILGKYGSHKTCCIGGARTSNENAYFFNKFAREYLETPHIDCCARICHAPSLAGLKRTVGEGAATNPFESIYKTDFILIIGSNTTEAHPIVASKISRAIKKGAKLAVVDVRETAIMKQADYKLVIPYETNLLTVNKMAQYILENNLQDDEFIKNRCEGFDEYKKELLAEELQSFANLEGYEDLEETVKEVAKIYAQSNSMILWGLGVSEHIDGSDTVSAFSNLALLTGNVGKEEAGLMPLRGQNNVQGACDMGCLPYYDLGYSQPKEEGLKTPDLIDEMIEGNIKFLYNMGEDIAHVHPNLNKVHKAFEKLEFIVVNELFPNEITKFADIVFGVKSQYEKQGVYTNAERRIKLTNPLYENSIPDDWEIFLQIARELGKEGNYVSSEDIWKEVQTKKPERYGGASYERLKQRDDKGMQWPIPDDDTPHLHLTKFSTENGLGKFLYRRWEKRGHVVSLETKDGQFYLTTGRIIEHYNNAAQTKESEKLWNRHNEDILLVSDLDNFDEEKRYILKSAFGETRPLKIKITNKIKKGTMFTSFHHSKSKVNFLFGDESDSLTKTAKFKSIEVEIISGV